VLFHDLLTHPDELITRERLMNEVWDWDNPVGTRLSGSPSCGAHHMTTRPRRVQPSLPAANTTRLPIGSRSSRWVVVE